MSPTTRSVTGATMLRAEPGDGEFALFAFPYAGVGASATYHAWPREIGDGVLCPLQPPGREDRTDEAPLRTHREFADATVAAISGYVDRRYAFIGHCGAFPYLVETTFRLQEAGLPLPERLFCSSWGPAHRGLYGRLSFVDLETFDAVAEIQDICLARMGFTLPADHAELAARSLLFDMRVERGYAYDGEPRIPVPVTVIGWSADEVVPPSVVWPGWEGCADADFHLLDGDHWSYLEGPPELAALVAAAMKPAAEFDDSAVVSRE
ncbi:thioesterase II family protein [Actinospica robiniae]|uniref:thioesterase II family protein n=1 Tax=Actinospica robiniae TaxID=304901 RepID=UPI0004169E6A|nr:thioesterase domain-containing protein [Actinospica robiniae]